MKSMVFTLVIAVSLARSAAGDSPDPLVFASEVSELRMRASSEVTGDTVTIGDVLDFSQADPRLQTALIGQVMLELATMPDEAVITHPQVVARLSELGVNMSRVLISGSFRCRVRVSGGAEVRLVSHEQPLIATPANTGAVTGTPAAPLMPDASAPVNGTFTLADKITSFVQGQRQSSSDIPEIEFERGRQEFLSLTSPPFDFKIRAANEPQLGMREFRVRIQRDGKTHRNLSIFGRVRLVRDVLVAAKPLSIGSFLKPDSVTTATRIFEADEDLGIQTAENVAGQRVQAFVPAGQMICARDLKAVDMVIRSRPVSLFSDGEVGVRLAGTALDSGGLGEVVRVRIGESRNSHRVMRGTVVGVARVRLLEQG
jgi:flagella basal body P-ring formation protein FlgA